MRNKNKQEDRKWKNIEGTDADVRGKRKRKERKMGEPKTAGEYDAVNCEPILSRWFIPDHGYGFQPFGELSMKG